MQTSAKTEARALNGIPSKGKGYVKAAVKMNMLWRAAFGFSL
jgi:hypothetical protein